MELGLSICSRQEFPGFKIHISSAAYAQAKDLSFRFRFESPQYYAGPPQAHNSYSSSTEYILAGVSYIYF
jgi:hypothetical protein